MTISTRPANPHSPVPWLPIAAVIACVSVFATSLGLTYPLFAIILEGRGYNSQIIGLNAAMTPLGLILTAPFTPRVAQRVGAWRLAIGSVTLMTTLFVLLGATESLAHWFILRFLMGLVDNGLFVTSETWINQMATREMRGRIMGIYTTTLASGFAIGPFLIPLTGTGGWGPFLVGAAIAAVSLVALLAVRGRMPAFQTEGHGSVLGFLPLAPNLLAAVAAVALADAALLSFLPIYGLRHGLNEATAAQMVGAATIGNIFLQYPIGWLADRTSSRLLILACSLCAIVGALLLPFAISLPAFLWPMLVVWGGTAFGVYTAALVALGDRFTGGMLLAGNAAFAVMWGAGGIAGGPLTGGAIGLVGVNGLPLVFGLAYAVLVIYVALYRPRPLETAA